MAAAEHGGSKVVPCPNCKEKLVCIMLLCVVGQRQVLNRWCEWRGGGPGPASSERFSINAKCYSSHAGSTKSVRTRKSKETKYKKKMQKRMEESRGAYLDAENAVGRLLAHVHVQPMGDRKLCGVALRRETQWQQMWALCGLADR